MIDFDLSVVNLDSFLKGLLIPEYQWPSSTPEGRGSRD